jgi:hypothetical protein
MSGFADWLAPSLLRTTLSLIVAALLVATCVKWLRLRSPAGEQWAWLLILTQGVMFVWLTVPTIEDWLPAPEHVLTPAERVTPRLPPAERAVDPFPFPELDPPQPAPGRERHPIKEPRAPEQQTMLARW